MNIHSNTLYYLFSTIAQVLAATTALTAIFLQFKLSDLKNILIGDGQAIYQRALNNESGYEEILSPKTFGRLRDALGRRDLDEIEGVLNELSREEINQNITLDERPTGFQFVHLKFINTLAYSSHLKQLTKSAIIFSLITILTSIICISIIDFIEDYLMIQLILIVGILILSLISIIKTYNGISEGLN